MKTKTSAAKISFLLVVLTIPLLMAGCTLSAEEREYERAEDARAAGSFEKSIEHYSRLIDRYVKTPLALESAAAAAQIAHFEIKDHKKAIGFYKHLVLYSPSAETRVEAQRKIAELYFKQLTDYKQSIVEYNRLLELPHTKEDGYRYRLTVAYAYFYLNNFFQALIEVDSILAKDYDPDLLFEPMLLKGNIYINTSKLEEAIKVFTELTEKYPERSKKETVGLQLAVCYEELKNFAKAIEVLETIRDSYATPEFIDLRIKRLRERQTYLPGARGLRK